MEILPILLKSLSQPARVRDCGAKELLEITELQDELSPQDRFDRFPNPLQMYLRHI